MGNEVKLEDIISLQEKIGKLRWDYWRDDVLLTWPWWFLLLSMLVLIFLWWKTVDRTRFTSIVTFGLFIFASALFFDTFGAELILWDYPYMVLPWGSRLFCVDLMIAIFMMWLYQWFVSWPIFLIGATVMSTVFSFVLEPLAVWMEIYSMYAWKHYYSFPIYILLAAVAKLVIDAIVRMQEEAMQDYS